MELPLARPVSAGSHLRIIAPAGPFNHETFDKGVAWLRERYEVSFADDIYSKSGYFAGDDSRRSKELVGAIEDDSVDAILCARGGFGTTRLLPDLSLESISRANKSIIGFSDITALHATWARAGVRSIHAPMAAALGNASDAIREAWVASVENANEETEWQLNAISSCIGNASGRFFGGNLAVLASLLGTPYAPPLEGTVLFLEDVGERPYRIDRVLTTLHQAGWFESLAAIILGSFTEGDPGPDGVHIDEVFADHFGDRPYPVLSGFPAGHISENQPITFGAKAEISSGTLTLTH